MAVFKRPAPPTAATTNVLTVSSSAHARPPVRPPARPLAPPQAPTGRAAPPSLAPAKRPTKTEKSLPKEEKNTEEARPVIEENRQDHTGVAPENTPDPAPTDGWSYFREGEDYKEGQVTMIKLRSMSIAEKHELWKRLNRGTDGTVFVPILRREDMPKKVVKEHPPDKRPAGKNVMWCCYCADWTIYEHFTYMGSDKCIGCGISTKDFYIRSANHLWKKEV